MTVNGEPVGLLYLKRGHFQANTDDGVYDVIELNSGEWGIFDYCTARPLARVTTLREASTWIAGGRLGGVR